MIAERDILFELVRYCYADDVYQHIQYSWDRQELQDMADWLCNHTDGQYGVRIAKADYDGNKY